MATTVRKMIVSAMRKINVLAAGEVPTSDDINICLDSINQMLDSWSNYRGLIYTIQDYEFPVVGGQATYTLGPGGDWDIERPMAIEQAYVRLNSGTQQQLDIQMGLMTDAQYANLPVKNTPATFGWQLYDDKNYPLRDITIFPIPNGTQGSVVLWLRQPLADFDSIDEIVSYPPGYERAFIFSLAVEIAAEFGKTVDPTVSAIATTARGELIRLNHVPRYRIGDGGMSWSRSYRNSAGPWITGGFFPGSRV